MDQSLIDESHKLFDLLETQENDANDVLILIQRLINKLSSSIKVPLQSTQDDCSLFTTEQFRSHKESAECLLPILYKLVFTLVMFEKFSKTVRDDIPNRFKNEMASVYIVAAQFAEDSVLWSSEKLAELSNQIIQLLTHDDEHILRNHFETTASRRLRFNVGNLLQHMLLQLEETLIKDHWKKDPGMIAFCKWLIRNLDDYFLSKHLGSLLPSILLQLDDWEEHNKIAGMEAVLYVLNHVPASELRSYGRGEVLSAAAKHHLYSRQPQILTVAYPACIKAATVLQGDSKIDHSLEFTPVEEVLSHLLREMRYEQRLDLRSVYARNLPAAIEAAEILSVRWSGEIIPVLEDYMTFYGLESSEDVLNTIEAARKYIKYCWPQAGRHAYTLFCAVLKLLYSLPQEKIIEKSRKNMLLQCRRLCEELRHVQPQPKQDVFDGLFDVQVPDHVKTNIQFVFQSTSPYIQENCA